MCNYLVILLLTAIEKDTHTVIPQLFSEVFILFVAMILYFCVIVVLLMIVIYQLNKPPSCEVIYRSEQLNYTPNRSNTIAGSTLDIGDGQTVSSNGKNVYLSPDLSYSRTEKKLRLYDKVSLKLMPSRKDST